jgi:DNA invertase Pin-like site-specific DNA recombinase
VSLACRCTPTLVRRVRVDGERNPETGREEGSLQHARDLLASGMSLRQVAVLTGISKSTLHRQARVASGSRGQ